MTKFTGIKEFHCNRCGRYHQTDYDKKDENGFDEENYLGGNFFHEFSNIFGYGSPYDDDKMTFTLCEICLFEIAKDFKHAPELIYHRAMPDEKPHSFDYEKFSSIRKENDPHYDNFFINWYKFVENLPRK